jgi:hypothetical protein
MVLDNEKARTFDCQNCDYNLQFNRNCCNYYEPAKIILNDKLYPQCPRSITFNYREDRFLVDLYFECKENKCYPSPGTIIDQTAYVRDYFDFIDGIVNKYRAKKLQEQESKNKSK